MLKTLTRLIMGDPNAKYLRDLRIDAEDIGALAEDMAALKDADFPEKTKAFKDRLAQGKA